MHSVNDTLAKSLPSLQCVSTPNLGVHVHFNRGCKVIEKNDQHKLTRYLGTLTDLAAHDDVFVNFDTACATSIGTLAAQALPKQACPTCGQDHAVAGTVLPRSLPFVVESHTQAFRQRAFDILGHEVMLSPST